MHNHRAFFAHFHKHRVLRQTRSGRDVDHVGHLRICQANVGVAFLGVCFVARLGVPRIFFWILFFNIFFRILFFTFFLNFFEFFFDIFCTLKFWIFFYFYFFFRIFRSFLCLIFSPYNANVGAGAKRWPKWRWGLAADSSKRCTIHLPNSLKLS